MSVFQTDYTPQGAGANYARLTMGQEDDIFFSNPEVTQWKQSWSRYSYHHAAVVNQAFQNPGLGRTNVVTLIKTMDFIHKTYIMQHYPAIRPNGDGVVETSWVNCPALWSIRLLQLKIGAQTVFSIDGTTILMLIELTGMLEHYAPMIGFSFTKAQLIADSKHDRNLYAPLVGLPFHDRSETAYPIGLISFHNVSLEFLARPLNEMVINYGGVMPAKKGLYALPFDVKNNALLNANSVDMMLSVNCVWISPEERHGLQRNYQEMIFKEYSKAGEHTIVPSANSQKVNFDLNIKGPCTGVMVTIISQTDLDNLNWTKLCQDSGLDYVDNLMLITGTTPREDGLPAEALRTLKPLEVYKVTPRRHIYLFSFELDATSAQMTGHQNMTNVDKIKLEGKFKPHSYPIIVTATSCVLNGAYNEKGTGGKVWA